MIEKEKNKGITVKKEENMPEWFEQVCLKAELAEFSDVKGCMVVRPAGWAIWESIQDYFNKRIKKIGVKNAAFPLLIPEHYFKKEAEHAEGFSPEVAWVTHAGKNKLEEKLAIRPTSETVIAESFKRWIRSYRDLPIKVNQWCSVVRWETKQTKLFLRSREFWWQEGHCVYETNEECVNETIIYLEEYKKLCEELLAIPVLTGKKTEKEKFAGAKETYAVEAIMPDGKGLQLGTTHNLGQGFMKVFGVEFIGKDEKIHIPYSNSWGISTRMIGGLVMIHSDDKGLVLPPKIAPIKAVIVPIFKEKDKEDILKAAREIKRILKMENIFIDDRDEYNPGWKFNEWEMKGIPLRIEIGPKDLKNKQAVLARRDNGEKKSIKIKDLKREVDETLDDIQYQLFKKAQIFLTNNTVEASDWKEFTAAIEKKKLVKAYFCGEIECEDLIKDKTNGANSRCIPFDQPPKMFNCVHCGKKGKHLAYFSKSY